MTGNEGKEVYAIDQSEKIRIALVIWSLEGLGGSETMVYDITRKIVGFGYLATLITFKDGPVRNLYEAIGIKVVVINKGRGFDVKLLFNLVAVLKTERIQIVYAHHITPFLYSFIAAKIAKAKIVFTEHSIWQFNELNIQLKALITRMMNNSDCIISISKQLHDYYLNDMKIDNGKVYLIINGIDFDKFKIYDCRHLREQLGFEEKDILIGIVANLRPEKNHKILISAFEKLSKVYQKIKLLIIGLDCMNGEIQRFVEKSTAKASIHFLGKRDDIPNWLNILDIFCLPSKNEGLPLTIVEAMACGVPIVGSNVMGINEVIIDGYNGLLFDIDDPDSLIEKFQTIINEETTRKTLMDNALHFVQRNYNIDDKIKEFDRIFRRI